MASDHGVLIKGVKNCVQTWMAWHGLGKNQWFQDAITDPIDLPNTIYKRSLDCISHIWKFEAYSSHMGGQDLWPELTSCCLTESKKFYVLLIHGIAREPVISAANDWPCWPQHLAITSLDFISRFQACLKRFERVLRMRADSHAWVAFTTTTAGGIFN